jgi:hypothetical protein
MRTPLLLIVRHCTHTLVTYYRKHVPLTSLQASHNAVTITPFGLDAIAETDDSVDDSTSDTSSEHHSVSSSKVHVSMSISQSVNAQQGEVDDNLTVAAADNSCTSERIDIDGTNDTNSTRCGATTTRVTDQMPVYHTY